MDFSGILILGIAKRSRTMTLSYSSETALFLATWIVYSWVKNQVSWMRLRRFGRKNGCEEPKVLKNELPGGIERYYGTLKFKKGMYFVDFFMIQKGISDVG